MRKNRRIYKPLVLLLIALMVCSTTVLPTGIRPVQADDGNLADKAAAFLETEYQNNGAQGGIAGIGSFDAYVLSSAGVDVSGWEHSGVSLTDAVTNLVNQDISDAAAPVKHLAQDLISMQELGNSGLVDQLKVLLQNRQNDDGSFQDDNSVYSIIPAYELLGRAGQLSIINADYAQGYILGQQDSTTGAWPPGDWPDFMVTAQAVRALNYLAPGAAPDSAVGQAVASGCNWLRQWQKSDGGFQATGFDDPLIDTAEAVATQMALGLDPAVAWTVDGKSAVDYLNDSALNDDGSFGSSGNVLDATWALDSFVLLGILPTGGGGGGGDPSTDVSVRVRVEGITGTPVDTTVSVSGTALDALNQAVGSDNVAAPGGFISSINGESGNFAGDPPTSWFYYAVRNGEIDPVSLGSAPSGYNVQDGDQVVFYIGAYDASTYEAKTYLPVVSISPQAPTAGQTITISISAKKYDWSTGLQDLSGDETAEIGDYTVTAGGAAYTSSFGQVTIPDVAAGTLSYVITNPSAAGYPDVVPYRGSISMPATVTADDTTVEITISAAQSDAPITVNIDEGVNNTKISVAALVSTTGGTAATQPLPALNINASVQFRDNQNPVAVQVSLPAGTTISADAGWDGTIQAPSVVDPTALPAGVLPANTDVSSANVIAVGFGDVQLTFSEPVKMVLPGQHGKSVGFIQNNTFTQINTVLGSNTAAALIAAGVQEGYYDDGTDITIWTKHFTSFVAYSVSGSGSPSSSDCTPGVAVVGMSGEILFGPSTVTVLPTNPWGLTALGALDATGLPYTTSATWEGYVDSIAGQAGSGTNGWMYTVNGATPMVSAKDYAVSSGDEVIWYYSSSMDQAAPTWAQLTSGKPSASLVVVTSTTGEAIVNPAAGGTVGLGSEVSLTIPAGALNGTVGAKVVIKEVSSPPAAPAGFKLLGSVFEFTVDDSSSYKFNQPVTLTFSFDSAALTQGEKPAVYYYDKTSLKWVDLGGTVSGSTVTVSVDHFTKFALFIKEAAHLPVPEPVFTDVQASFWAREAINKLSSLGCISGYPDGTFKPDNQITRAEVVSILNKALKLSTYNPEAPDFSDVTSEDWFYGAVENAVHAGIIKGYDNFFNPRQHITREELAAVMVNARGRYDEARASTNEETSFKDDASISDWARGFVVVAVKDGLIKGYPDSGFNPRGSATRAEVCVIVANLLNLSESIP